MMESLSQSRAMNWRKTFVIFSNKLVSMDNLEACHHLNNKARAKVKFLRRRDCGQILRAKNDLKHINATNLDFSEDSKTFVDESINSY